MQKFGNFKIENTIPTDLKLCHIAIIIQNLLYQNIKRERKKHKNIRKKHKKEHKERDKERERVEQNREVRKPKSYSQLIFEQCTKMQNGEITVILIHDPGWGENLPTYGNE